MKAAVLYDVGTPLAIEDLTLLAPKDGEVRVRYVASGVCHSDLHYIKGDRPYPKPVVLGHEGAGIVEEVGPGVSYAKPGDHVILSFVPACGRCTYCVEGRPNMCAVRYSLNGNLPDGSTRLRKGTQEIKHFACMSSFAEYGVVPEGSLVKIPDHMPLDKAALVGCCVTTGRGGRPVDGQGRTRQQCGRDRLWRRRPQRHSGSGASWSRADHRGRCAAQQTGVCQTVWGDHDDQCTRCRPRGGGTRAHRWRRRRLRLRGHWPDADGSASAIMHAPRRQGRDRGGDSAWRAAHASIPISCIRIAS